MSVFHIGILTETERSKVVRCKTATHLNFGGFFAHNGTAVTHKMHLCGAGREHKEKPVMQHPFPDCHEGSCPKLAALDRPDPALLYWNDAVAGERQGQQAGEGCGDARVPETQQSKLVAWKSLHPTWCADVTYPDLEFAWWASSRRVGRALKGPLHLRGRAGSSGRDEQGEEQTGSGSSQGPHVENH